MKARELIAQLQQVDPDMEVAIGTLNPRDSMPDTQPVHSLVRWDGKAVVMGA
jgi:hypothetical protein